MDVMIVDDKETNRKLLRSMLSIKGFNVIEADSGLSAIKLFQELNPSIILMDIMMPDMNGYEATTRIKSISRQSYIPIIFVTALKPEEAIKKATESGGDDFVCKPINLEILESKIHAHLRIRDLNEQLNQANLELVKHNRRIQQEHDIVEHIFKNALKYSFLDKKKLNYYVSPVSAFNGDLLLAEKKPNGNYCVFLGDFTGHGLPAAMGTLPVVKSFFTMVRKGISPGEIASELNSTLKMLLPSNMFCSAIIAELNSSSNELTIWSGGLPEMILYNPNTSSLKTYECQHMALGILNTSEFESDTLKIPVEPGSRLFLYTDGIIETSNSDGIRFGSERIITTITSNPHNSFDALLKCHAEFRSGTNQDDDLTMIEIICHCSD